MSKRPHWNRFNRLPNYEPNVFSGVLIGSPFDVVRVPQDPILMILQYSNSCPTLLTVQNSAIPEEECGWEPLILDSLVLEELPGLSIRERMLGMNVSNPLM